VEGAPTAFRRRHRVRRADPEAGGQGRTTVTRQRRAVSCHTSWYARSRVYRCTRATHRLTLIAL